MPPKGANALKSERYAALCASIKQQKTQAKELLANLKKQKKKEDKRHSRLMKSAAKLDSKDLMELAGINKITLAQLASFASECGVEADGVPEGGHHAHDPGHAHAEGHGGASVSGHNSVPAAAPDGEPSDR